VEGGDCPMQMLSTFSIVAIDLKTGEIGVAVASKFLAVGAVVPYARAGVGAIATQAWANLSFGPRGLELLASGLSAEEVVEHLVREDEGRDHRQLGVVDAQGRAAAWTGKQCYPWAGHIVGEGYTCQGNILAGETVVRAMAEAFHHTPGPLPERLLEALAAGQAQGGDSRGQQSAALYVAKEKGSYGGYLDRYIDLRVDDHPHPIEELRKLLRLHRLYFGTTVPGNLIRAEGNVVREIQRILAKLGYYHGEQSGVYDEATRKALKQFFDIENFEERWRDDDFIDREVLNFMRERYGASGVSL
jgi:uncharacterized Ntn-hydrolase superfamily protein